MTADRRIQPNFMIDKNEETNKRINDDEATTSERVPYGHGHTKRRGDCPKATGATTSIEHFQRLAQIAERGRSTRCSSLMFR